MAKKLSLFRHSSVLLYIWTTMDVPFRASAAILGLKMQSLMATVSLLQLFNIIASEGVCCKCNLKIIGAVKEDGNNLFWWCNSCRVRTPVRKGTVLSNSNLKLERFVLLMYYFINRSSTYEQMLNDACLPNTPGYKECSMSFSTISKWFKYFTFICSKDYDETNHKIGGAEEIVEIDESLFGKAKYAKGDFSKRRRKWVFGGIDRRTRRAFVRICPKNKRTKKALWPIIQANVLPQTTIYSDGWRAYRKLPTLGYKHAWVDHSKHFVDPDNPTLHTNGVEGLWGTIKRWLPQSGAYNLEKNLKLFLWFEDQKLNGKDPFWSLVKLVAKYNSVDILQQANLVEDDMEGYDVDEEGGEGVEDDEEEEEEEEDSDSDAEIEDEFHTLLFSCPFCMRVYEDKLEMENHVDSCMPV